MYETLSIGRDMEEIYFFGTCLVDLWAPNAGMSAIKLIQKEGIKVIYPRKQTCCGQPAFNSGFRDEAKSVAMAQIKLFPKDIPIVVPSSSCSAMMKFHYNELFKGDPMEEEVMKFSSRIYELTWFLVHKLNIKLKDKGAPTNVTWHASCHAIREMGIKDEPLTLLTQLKNVEVKRLKKEKECCGFGGTFAVKHPEISGAMVSDKADDIISTEADKVLGGDCGCLMNIGGHLDYRKEQTSATHLAEFLWERTK